MIFTDPIIHNLHQRIINELGEIDTITPKTPELYFADLVEQIIGQQLSILVADKIIERVKQSLGGTFTPHIVLETPQELLRSVGMSNAKAQYIKNIALAFQDGSLGYPEFSKLEDEQIISQLVKIKGIGRWTAEMFLIFTMGRADVFSIGDLALRKTVTKNYGFESEPQPGVILQISEKWSPHRSLASRILWKSLKLT